MRVVRELTESRSKLVAGKSIMAEKFAELQAEYLKARAATPKPERPKNLKYRQCFWTRAIRPCSCVRICHQGDHFRPLWEGRPSQRCRPPLLLRE